MKKKANLFQYTKGYRVPMVLSPLCVIIEVVLEIVIPYVIGVMIDSGFTNVDYELFKRMTVLLVILAICSLTSGVLSAIFASKAASGFAKQLRFSVFSKIQEFSFSSIDKFSPSGLVTRLTGDIVNIQIAYQMIIRIAIRLPIMVVVALIMSFNVAPNLAVIYCVVLPLMILVMVSLMCSVIPLFVKGFKIVDETNEITGENLHAMRVVKSYVREDEEKRKFDRVNYLHFMIFRKANQIISLGGPTLRLVLYICLILLSYRGTMDIVKGQMTTGALMSMFSYNTQILFSIMMFAMITSMVVMSAACYNRVKEVLNEEITIKNGDNPIMEVKDGSIDLKNVSFSYYNNMDKLALKNISFHIPQGSVVGIIGATGSGKSSLISLFARLYDVTSGEIDIGGVNVKDYDLTTLRNAVAIVLQKNTLFSGTIRSNMKWGNPDASDDEIYSALETAQIKTFIEGQKDKLDYIVEQNGDNFSGGQKQRLCIARALLKNPKVIVMDDSSSALDTATERALQQALRNDHKECTKVIIAGKVNSVKESDMIIVLRNGEIENIGTHDDLIEKSEFYSTLCRVQGVTK